MQEMKFYLAPMEGVTGYIFRNAHKDLFHNIDKYFTPFIVANQTGKMKNKEKKEILPENNQGLYIVPQILTNNADDFVRTAKDLKSYGYKEINLNLGCPAGTVVAKCKGSGFLAERERLNLFLEDIYSNTEDDIEISIKTRIGKDSPDEFYEIMEIYNQYPIKELIIHPRIQKDFYKNTPNLKVFQDAFTISNNPVCYNGDIFNVQDFQKFHDQFPKVNTIMLGRGLIANPGLIRSIKENRPVDKTMLKEFHDRILHDYEEILSPDINVLYKMKEVWFYMIPMFDECESYAKKIRKCSRLSEYKMIIANLFANCELRDNAGFLPR